MNAILFISPNCLVLITRIMSASRLFFEDFSCRNGRDFFPNFRYVYEGFEYGCQVTNASKFRLLGTIRGTSLSHFNVNSIPNGYPIRASIIRPTKVDYFKGINFVNMIV